MLSTSKALFRKPGNGATPTTDATFGYVPLLLETGSASSLNTTVTDSSASPNTVTRVNNPSTGWVSPYQTDGYWGNLFSSASDGLTFAASAGFVLTGGAFTIEFWAYPTVGSNYDTIIDGGMLSGFGLTRRAGTNAIVWQAGGAQLEVGTTFLLNQWNHIVANYTGTGSVNLYINGASVSSAASIPTNTGTIALYVGKYSAGQPFAGYISNVRIVKGSAVYTNGSTITVPTAPLTPVTNTQLLTCYSNRFIDANTATTAKTLTVTGTPQVTPYFYPSGFTAPAASPGAGLFAAASSQTLITTQTQVIPTGSFTIEVWAYVTSSTATQVFVSQGTSGSAGRTAIGIDNSSGAKWFCQVGGVFVYSSAAPTLNTWNYLAMTYNGATIALYLNGTLLNSASNTTSAQNSQLRVGGLWTPATAGYYLDGYLANIRVSNTVRTVTSVPTTFLTSDANTTLLLNLADSNYTSATNGVQNNTFIDSSNYAFPITRNGTPTQGSITPYWPNGQWSNYFNGTTDYLTVASNSGLAFGTNNFTIEFWIYLNSVSAAQFFYSSQSLGSYTVAPDIYQQSGKLYVQVSSTNPINGTGPTTLVANRWYHIALVKSSGTSTLYVNGAVEASFSDSNTYTIGANRPLVGVYGYSATNYYLNGYLSNLRVVNGTAIVPPSGGPTAPLTPVTNTSLLTCQSNRFLDTNTQLTPKVITPSGTPTVQAFQPFSPTASYTTALYGGSSLFPTSADYLTIAANAVFTLGTQNHTVEFWAYQTAFTNYSTFWAYAGGATAQATDSYYLSNGSLGSNLLVGAGGSTWGVNIAYTQQTLNTWHHYAITRSGNSWALFIDGTRVGTATYAGSITAQTQPMSIGRTGGTTDSFQGYISNLRIVKGTAVYDPAQTTITVPTSPLTAITNTVLLVNGTNAGIYDAAVQNDVTTVSNAQASSTPTAQWPPTSMKFNGSTDYLTAPFSPSLSFGSSNFTIEAWIYFSTLPSNTWYTIYSYGNTNGLPRFILYFDTRTSQSSPGLRFTIINSGGTAILDFNGGGTSGWNSGVWYYVAITRNANTWTLYRNGSSIGTTTNSSAVPAVTNGGAYIGVEPSGIAFFNGSIQDFRITNGVARTITTPTAAFPTR